MAGPKANNEEYERRLMVVEDLMGRLVPERRIEVECAAKWGIGRRMVRKYIVVVQALWREESSSKYREERREKYSRVLERVARRTEKDRPATAVAALKVLSRIHGLEQIDLKVGINENLVQLMQVAQQHRAKMAYDESKRVEAPIPPLKELPARVLEFPVAVKNGTEGDDS